MRHEHASDDDEAPNPLVPDDRETRWRLILGGNAPTTQGLSDRARRLDGALTALYGAQPGTRRAGSLGRSQPKVSAWLDDIREFFPSQVVQVIQKDAFERLGLDRMLLEPEFLAAVTPDVHVLATLISLRNAVPAKSKEAARRIVEQVVRDLLERLETRTMQSLRGALNRTRRTRRPRLADVDWARTINANLRHYQPAYRTVIPETLIGFARRRQHSELDQVILCVDQSGSMATSVIYASIFAAVMASIPTLDLRLVAFDSEPVDLSDVLDDPVELLFGIQLGGGTDIDHALAYCETLVRVPTKTHLVLISDLIEGGDQESMRGRAARLIASGVRMVTLLALSDEGRPTFDTDNARFLASLGSPVFGCTPEQFPELMATALRGGDIAAWTSEEEIERVRPAPTP